VYNTHNPARTPSKPPINTSFRLCLPSTILDQAIGIVIRNAMIPIKGFNAMIKNERYIWKETCMELLIVKLTTWETATRVSPNNRLRHKFMDWSVKKAIKVTTLRMGIIKKNIDLRCILSETSKLVYEPFRDLRYNRNIKGIKKPPIMMVDVINAFLKSSNVNVTITTNSGIVNNGCPATEIIWAIFFFINYLFKTFIIRWSHSNHYWIRLFYSGNSTSSFKQNSIFPYIL